MEPTIAANGDDPPARADAALDALRTIVHALHRPGIIGLTGALNRLLEVQAIALDAIERSEGRA
jgi:hypothetical protein